MFGSVERDLEKKVEVNRELAIIAREFGYAKRDFMMPLDSALASLRHHHIKHGTTAQRIKAKIFCFFIG